MRLPISQQIKKDLSGFNRKVRKKLVKIAKLYIVPEQAKIGPALAQIGINSMEFCERFNSQTRTLDKELILPVRINVFSDKSFSYQIKLVQLKDLVVSFNLDEKWPLLVRTNSVKQSVLLEEITLAFYKAFLVHNTVLTIKDSEQFIKTYCAYLKSFQNN